MKIIDVICSKSYTGFYFDDQKAIKAGAKTDGFTYTGEAMTAGFNAVRQPGEAISVMFILEDGTVGHGDCAAVQYSGAGGRDPLFSADVFIPFIDKNLKPLLIGEDVSKFKELAEKYDKLEIDGKKLHTAIRYGISQALLDSCAKVNKITMAEVVRNEYKINLDTYKAIDVFTQSGDDRYNNADKMIIKEADVLPHALINNVETKLGKNGELLLEYVEWLRDRIIFLRQREEYSPIFHIDVYGTIGIAFDYDNEKMANYCESLAKAASPFKIRIEGPMDMGNHKDQISALAKLTKTIDEREIECEIVADEWCNTYEDIVAFAEAGAGHMLQIKTPDLGGVNNCIEAILYCKQNGVGAYSGGTCNETNKSAEVTTNIAIACNACQCLAKPGMGVDEGFMIVKNEMNRVIALANSKKA
ncbi:MAG: methylaspartate ammonia-lyase [Bacilli bacterium]